MQTAWLCLGAVLLDQLLGEPRRWHPLVEFGKLTRWLETQIYGSTESNDPLRRGRGIVAVILLLVPSVWIAHFLAEIPIFGVAVSWGVLYLAIGARSLSEHAQAVGTALRDNDLPLARERVGRIVSRDTEDLNEEQISRATVESVLENGNDAVFGALLWFVLAGAPGVVLYRLANTLDAMWGYRTPRYQEFGWAAARLDDVLNWIPARLTALSYVVVSGRREQAWRCWREQGEVWKSSNAGSVMAAGAGALNVALGGLARYHGGWVTRPPLGEGLAACAGDIQRAVRLLWWALGAWLAIILLGGWAFA